MLAKQKPKKKRNKKEPSAVNHIPYTKLSQLYSTEKTSDQSSVSACLDREGTSSLTGLELDKESGAPRECARWAWDSHFKRGKHFYFFFLSITATDLRGAQGSLCLHLVSSFQLKMWNEAQVQAIIIRSFQVTKNSAGFKSNIKHDS